MNTIDTNSLQIIISHLLFDDLANSRLVCKQWNNIATDFHNKFRKLYYISCDEQNICMLFVKLIDNGYQNLTIGYYEQIAGGKYDKYYICIKIKYIFDSKFKCEISIDIQNDDYFIHNPKIYLYFNVSNNTRSYLKSTNIIKTIIFTHFYDNFKFKRPYGLST